MIVPRSGAVILSVTWSLENAFISGGIVAGWKARRLS
jgi:hypothetical protein